MYATVRRPWCDYRNLSSIDRLSRWTTSRNGKWNGTRVTCRLMRPGMKDLPYNNCISSVVFSNPSLCVSVFRAHSWSSSYLIIRVKQLTLHTSLFWRNHAPHQGEVSRHCCCGCCGCWNRCCCCCCWKLDDFNWKSGRDSRNSAAAAAGRPVVAAAVGIAAAAVGRLKSDNFVSMVTLMSQVAIIRRCARSRLLRTRTT